jgi:predicted GTPase
MNLVSDLTRLRLISEKIGLEIALIQLIDDALLRNKEHRFSIAVVGEFKRGKSTFINALLGKEILPADIEPCSATLNRITYGLKPSVQVVFRESEEGGQGKVEEVDIEHLADYVTKLTPEAAQTASTVKEAIVTYPLAYLQNNVEIIDTPGLNDDVAMTEVTLGVLPHVSAAILVIMPEAPFAGSEADFLNHQLLLKDMGRIIFVVTAIDRVRKAQDRERILKVIADRIELSVERRLLEQFGSTESDGYKLYRKQIGKPRVFGLSGYLALEAKETNNTALLEESKFSEFESKLEQFVTGTRGAIELQVLSNRTIGAGNEILKKLTIELGALQMSQQEFDRAYSTAMDELQSLRQRRQEELQNINQASEQTKRRIRPLIGQLPEELKRAAATVVEETPMKTDDIQNSVFVEELSKKISTAVRNAAKHNSEKIQFEIERDVVEEIKRLGNYAAEVNQTLRDIELQFAGTNPLSNKGQIAGTAAALAIGGLTATIWGGVLAGWQEAGGKGAAVGAAAGFGTIMAGSALIVALAIPVTWPVVIGLGIASTFAGKFAARYIFREQRIEQFRQRYTEQVFEQIEQQLQSQRLDILIEQHITNTYDTIRDKLLGELDASIEQTRSTLEQLRGQKVRQEALAEERRKEAEQLILEVQSICSRAQGLSQQLIEATEV